MTNKEIEILEVENAFLKKKIERLTELLNQHNIPIGGPSQEDLAICIDNVEISKRLYNNLQKFFNKKNNEDAMIMPENPIKITIGDLRHLSRETLMGARGFGVSQVAALEKILSQYNCELSP